MDGSVRYPVKAPRVSTMDHVSQRLCGGCGATHPQNHKPYGRDPQAALAETQRGSRAARTPPLPACRYHAPETNFNALLA